MSTSIKQDFVTNNASTIRKTSTEDKKQNSSEVSSQVLDLISEQLSGIELEQGSTELPPLSDSDLEAVMMLVGQLTTVIQQLEAEFQGLKGSANADIAQTMLDNAKASLDKVNKQLEENRKAREEAASSSWLDDLVTAVECVVSVVLMCIPGCQGMGAAMMMMLVLDKAGVTGKLAEALEKAGLPSAAAGILASAIMGIACGGVSGIAGAAMNSLKSTTEKVAIDAVRNAVKVELKEAIAQSVEAATKNCVEDETASLAQTAARSTAKSIMTKLSQVWGSDIVGGELKEVMKDGITDGLKRAGKSLSKDIVKDIAESAAKQAVEGIPYTAEFTAEGLSEAKKVELDEMISKFKTALKNSNLKSAAKAGVAETLSSLNSTGVMNQLAEWIVEQTPTSDESKKRTAKMVLSLMLTVVSVLAGAYACSGGSAMQSVGTFGKMGANISKRLKDFPKTLALVNALRNRPEMVLRTLQLSQASFQAAHGGVAIDVAVKLKETADIMAEYQPKVELYRNLATMGTKQIDEDQKVFEKLQAATSSMLEDAESIAQLMCKAAQEALN